MLEWRLPRRQCEAASSAATAARASQMAASRQKQSARCGCAGVIGRTNREDMTTSREPSIGNSDNIDPTTQTLGKVRAMT